VLFAALAALLWVGLNSAPASAANPGADLEQCRNGTFASPQQCTGAAWQTGNAGASNSHYREGDSVPFRAKLINLSTSGSHTLVIEHDTIDSGKHAYDYLTSYNRTEATADACSGISPCAGGSSFPIPVDPTITFANSSSTQVPGAISIWNGTITNIAYGASDPVGKRSVTVTFTATNSTVLLAWGGHIASQIDWGAGNSAGAISGSPYHMRLLDLDHDGLGNMDRSLAAAAVAPVPATFTTQVSSGSITLGQSITDVATLAGPNGTVSGTVSFFVCGPNLVSNPDCTTGGTAVGSGAILAGGSATSAGFTPTLPGKYCFRAQYSPDLFAQYSPGNHTNLTTECFEAVQPLGTLRVIKQVLNDNGGTKTAGDFSLHVKSGGTDVAGSPATGSATGTVYTLATGSYVVSEDAPPAGYAQTGISGDCAANGAVTVVPGVQKTCTITNDDISAKLIVIKHVVNDEAGNKAAADFTISVTGSAPSPASFAGAEAPGTQVSIRPGSYAVGESNPTGYTGSFSSDCTGSIALGETKTCTVTNSDNDVPSSILVTKSATPTSLPEPGGNATFDVTVKNTSAVDSVTITSLSDNVYGNLDGKGSCDVPQTIAAGGTYSCSFSGAVAGNAGSSHTDVVTASGTDDDGNPVADDDDATVTISNLPSSILVTKSATPTSLPEPGGNATFDVTVKNMSAVDSVTITSLSDDVYGNLDGKGSCDVPQTLAPGASYSCSFSGAVSGNAGSSHTDVVTASGTDDDGNPVVDDDDATVTISDLASSILVTKTADPTSLPEPGGNASFSVTVKNTSATDSVTITSLSDDVYGNLDNKGTCDVPFTLAPGASYDCAFTGAVSGNAGSSHTDVVTASGTDDDGNPVSDHDDAAVRITDTASSIVVTKTATPTSLPEPGGSATFDVKVENTSAVDSVTISSLSDDVYGNLDGKGSCDVPQTIAAGGSYSCSFSGAVSGNAGSSHTDVVTASGTDDDGNQLSDHDDATVTITDVAASIQVTKTADPTSLPEPGGNASFSVKIENLSTVDSVTISSLSDDVYGNLDGKGTCDVPQTIAAGGSYSCSFSGAVSGNAGSSHKDVVTASGTDDDGNPVSDDDDATVTITNLPSSIVVTKSATPTSLPEPGGNATFDVKIENTSAVDSVTISSLTDDVYGNLDGKGTCDVPQTLAPSASYDCSFSGAVSGNAGSAHKDIVTASGTDDDGNPVSDEDDATVTITNVPSSIAVTKSASPVSIQEPGGTVTFSVSVKNTSAVDSVTITSLSDDIYGNLDSKGTCDVPQTLAPGASYDCSFTGAVSGAAGSTHTDVVTASGTDDDGNELSGSDNATVTITAAPPPPPPPPTPAPPIAIVVAAPAIDLSITKTDRPDPVFVGKTLTYTLTVRNAGPDTATNVRVADALPGATTFVSVTSSQGTCTGGRVVRCSLGTMLSGGRATITIVVRPTEPGALLNTATVVGDQSEANTANNRATAPTLVRGPIAPPVASCPTLIVQPRSLSVGRRGVVRVVVIDKNRGVSGVRILVKGPGLNKAATTNGRGRVAISVRPPRTGIVEIRMTNQPSRCSTRRIGVVGVFLPPPVTG
jgi:uncharacterized repeat protein (TIGR01451 family)